MDKVIGTGIIVAAVLFITMRYYRIFTKKKSPCDSCGSSCSNKTKTDCPCKYGAVHKE